MSQASSQESGRLIRQTEAELPLTFRNT
ncbi:uncharacterized protein METZ01_LOCUS69937, partial [marine metagenome]